jgi:hypothetical protein
VVNLKKRFRRVRPEFFLVALTHSALQQGFLAKESLIVLDHLAPSGLCLYPIMKNEFRASHFEVAEKIQEDMTAIFNGLQEDEF